MIRMFSSVVVALVGFKGVAHADKLSDFQDALKKNQARAR